MDVVKHLIEHKADVNKWERDLEMSPLIIASSQGHLEVVKYLVTNGAHVDHTDEDGNTAVTHAMKQGHSEIAQYLNQLSK